MLYRPGWAGPRQLRCHLSATAGYERDRHVSESTQHGSQGQRRPDEAVEELRRRHARGDVVDPVEFLAKHPDLADEVRARLEPVFLTQSLLSLPTAETQALLLAAIASHRVGDRPGRVEPHVLKRSRIPYKQLRQPRSVAHQKRLLQLA